MSRKSKRKLHRPKGVAGLPRADEPARHGDWRPYVILGIAIFIAYQRVWHAGFIWDDDAHVTRPDLRSFNGLSRIWFEPGATQQYYPFLYSAFWLENRLWGYSALGYHLTNVALHAGVACLFYRVLRRLSAPGAFVAAAVFALHPVCVESVAWISEQKNTLSTFLYLLAALAYLRFDEKRRPGWYLGATLLFVLALLTKSVTATLPGALLVVTWWKRGRLSWKNDVAPLIPWLALGAGAGLVTAWVERAYVGAAGAGFELGTVERILVAGRAIVFYAGKLFWPANLIFIYPRWVVDARSPGQILFPVAVLGALALMFVLRHRSRAPLAVALLFIGTLSPALGFVDVFPFRFSYVADHFQYFAAAIMLSATVAGFALAAASMPSWGQRAARAAAYCAAATLGYLTWLQSGMYSDIGTLWQTTIARNPGCWVAYNDLGLALAGDGQVDAAIKEYALALEINPSFAGAQNNLGSALMAEGKVDDAIAHFQRAIELEPGDVESHNNLGMARRMQGRVDEAIVQYGLALKIRPGDLDTNYNLGNALLQAGHADQAILQFRRALEISPEFADAHNNLGNALRRLGRTDEAIAEYRKALAIDPANARAKRNLNSALSNSGN